MREVSRIVNLGKQLPSAGGRKLPARSKIFAPIRSHYCSLKSGVGLQTEAQFTLFVLLYKAHLRHVTETWAFTRVKSRAFYE